MNTDENLQKTLDLEYRDFGSYGKLAKHYGVNKGLIYKIIQFGHIPSKPEIRKKLRLPEIKKVVACIKCGEFHPRKRCSSGNHKKRNRLSINLDNSESAAKSIMNHMDREGIKELALYLNNWIYWRGKEKQNANSQNN